MHWDDFMALGIGFFMVAVIPLVGMLLYHQRKMAELFQRGAAQQDQQTQIDRLQAEVAALKDRINHLILTVDDKRELQDRIRQEPQIPLEGR